MWIHNGWLHSSVCHRLFIGLPFALLASVPCDGVSWMVTLVTELSKAEKISGKCFMKSKK